MQDRPANAAKPDGATHTTIFLRMATVVQMTGLGRSTIYRLIAEDQFPTPVRLAKRAVAWRRVDVERWSQARPSTTH